MTTMRSAQPWRIGAVTGAVIAKRLPLIILLLGLGLAINFDRAEPAARAGQPMLLMPDSRP